MDKQDESNPTGAPDDRWPVNFNEVRAKEQAAIRERRERQNLPGDEVGGNLVGLALSGGGLRSGAISLGVLQALYQRGVLRFVDYLSTVSGGGYAGAYLSSVALRSKADRANANGQAAFPIAAAIDAPQPPRMMDFIYGGHYLRRTWVFFNRYVIGLFLIWTVVLSGVLASTALVAWTFRHLDYPIARDWMGALGFDDDVTLALFPSLVLLVLWVGAWFVSYMMYRERATGKVARLLFAALIVVNLVAVAAMIGTGDLSLRSFTSIFGVQTTSESVNTFNRIFQTLLFSAIVASLLPYLHPKRLFQSGQTADSSTAERYIFWFASRALVGGVPFLFVAFFARENISGWNERRDGSLHPVEIKSWTKLDPRTIERDRNPRIDWNEEIKSVAGGAGNDVPPVGSPWRGLSPAELGEIRSLFDDVDRLTATGSRLQSYRPTEAALRDDLRKEHVLTQQEIPVLWRWLYLLQYLGQAAAGADDDANRNRVYQIKQTAEELRKVQAQILAKLNERLKSSGFAATILAGLTPHELLSGVAVTNDDKAWVAKVTSAYDAARLAPESATWVGAPAPDTDQSTEVEHDTELRDRTSIKANRALLQTFLTDAFHDQSVVYSGVVLDHDQRTRLRWFLTSLLVFVASGMLVGLNVTSWHGYYATQISRMWIEDVPGLGRDIPLGQLETTLVGFPYHLISGSLHLIGRKGKGPHYVSRDHFLFSQLYCGSDRLGAFCPTATFMDGTYSLANATAVSGAAVTPVGSTNPLLLALLFLGNVRMGQWVDNPAQCRPPDSALTGMRRWWPFTPIRFLVSMFQPAEERLFCFVTDGGHHENLGIEPLLKRRCRLIIASDAGQDERNLFADFTRLATRVRLEHGITFEPLSQSSATQLLDPLLPDEASRRSRDHYVIAKINYPESTQAPSYLLYMKSSLTGDEPHELLQFQKFNPSFPHDPTADQFYGPERFEAYRQLGYHIADVMCQRLRGANLLELDVNQFIAAMLGQAEAAPTQTDRVPDSLQSWVDRLNDESLPAEVREEAAINLEHVHDRPELIVPPLIKSLSSDDTHLVHACRNVLTTVARRASAGLFVPGLQHELPSVRATVAAVLAEAMHELVGIDERTVAALNALLSDKRKEVRTEARKALDAYCLEYGLDPDHRERVSVVHQRTRTK